MTEKLITYNTALLAKEKNANLISPGFYDDNKELIDDIEGFPRWYKEKYIQAPTQSLLQKWLREIHNIHLIVTSISQKSWQCYITKIGNSLDKNYIENAYTYEEALEEGLFEALNLIP